MCPRLLALAVAAALAAPGLARAQDAPAEEPAPQAAQCPPCECNCPAPQVNVPIPPEQNVERLDTRSVPIAIGDGGPPTTLLQGPFVIQNITATCPMAVTLRTGAADVSIALPTTRLFVPEGATLEIDPASAGFCSGELVYSGYRP